MTKTISTTHTTVTLPNPNPEKSILSIRQICMTGILAGKSTKEIAAEIQLHHPNSAAAAKSAKHIAWYKATMKKAGQLPAQQD